MTETDLNVCSTDTQIGVKKRLHPKQRSPITPEYSITFPAFGQEIIQMSGSETKTIHAAFDQLLQHTGGLTGKQ